MFEELSATTTVASELQRGKVTDTTLQQVKKIGVQYGARIDTVSKIPSILRTIQILLAGGCACSYDCQRKSQVFEASIPGLQETASAGQE